MNQFRNFECHRKTLPLNRSKVASIRKISKIKNLKKQRFEYFKNDEDPNEYASFYANKLARPNVRRLKSIFDKKIKKSKFDMLEAEKFCKRLEEPICTPKEINNYLKEQKRTKNKNVKKAVDSIEEFCKNIRFACATSSGKNLCKSKRNRGHTRKEFLDSFAAESEKSKKVLKN